MSPRNYSEGSQAHYRDAAYYDHVYRRRREDVRLYAELAAETPGAVLELGVGTGRVASAMAREGSRVVGVDFMPEMLERAQERCDRLPLRARGLVELHQGDLRKVRLGERFPLVVAPFNVFMHLYTREEIEQALETVKAHLAPGGSFVFDVLLPDPGCLDRDPERIYRGRRFRHPTTGVFHTYAELFQYDAVEQVLRVYMFAEPEGGPKEDGWMMELAHRQFFPRELEALLHYSGFEVQDQWGDFERQSLGPDSASQVLRVRLSCA